MGKTNNSGVPGYNEIPLRNISRRSFIKNVSATTAVGTAGLAGLSSTGCVKKVKYVKLGRTDMRVSQFLGDRMADRKLPSPGKQCHQ